MDGAPNRGQGLLHRSSPKNAIGPIFFEIIQRKGPTKASAKKFRALFESIEADQVAPRRAEG